MDNQPFAVFIKDVLLAAGSSSQILAQVETDKDEMEWPVIIGDKTAASITNPLRATDGTPNPRALTMLRKATPGEENVLISLTLLFALKL